jgi:uncharacterized protein involved in outer membrane biogenesis
MKKLFLIVGVIVVIIIAALEIGVSKLGPIIKNAVNTYGPKLTKTEVSLGDVNISILSGKANLKDLFLGNPQGFKSTEAMKVGSILVGVDEKSLTKDTIVIDTIEVIAPAITYEKTRGSDNFNAIINNANSFLGTKESKKEPAKKKSSETAGKKILIKDFIGKDGKVTLATSLFGGKSVSAPLPKILLTNVGGEGQGVSPGQVFGEIFKALHEKITSSAVPDTLNKGLKELGSAAGEGAKEQAGWVNDKVKGLLGK